LIYEQWGRTEDALHGTNLLFGEIETARRCTTRGGPRGRTSDFRLFFRQRHACGTVRRRRFELPAYVAVRKVRVAIQHVDVGDEWYRSCACGQHPWRACHKRPPRRAM